MKHARLIILFILLCTISIIASSAALAQGDRDGDGVGDSRDKCPDVPGPASNGGCPLLVVVTAEPPRDLDGDGIPDTDDQCPREAGPRENRGCPVTQVEPTRPSDLAPNPTAVPVQPDADGDGVPDANDQCPGVAGPADNGGCPVFVPPALPTDGCYVTPNGQFNVNVRNAPDMGAEVAGYLLPGSIYGAQGYIMNASGIWFVMSAYENNPGTTGFVSGSVLNASACVEIDPSGAPGTLVTPGSNGGMNIVNTSGEYPWQVGFHIGVGENPPSEPHDTFEYCVYEEVHEAGVFEEVCYEIEIPEGCVLRNPEAGVYIVDCGDGETVQVNPLFDNLPGVDFQAPSRDNTVPFSLGLQMTFNGPADPDPGPQTVEYCVYEEVHEVGVFEEVCYEIEIPEGCVLTTAEAGVFTLDCDGDEVKVNPALEGMPSGIASGQSSPVPLTPPAPMLMLYKSSDPGPETFEYCVYEEVHEAGVFEEVCYEIEVPEGCTLRNPEAGVYIVDCPEEGTINPDLGPLPGVNLIPPQNPGQPILIGLLLPAVQK